MEKLNIEVKESEDILKNTITRLSYLYPEYKFSFKENNIIVEGEKLDKYKFKQEVHYYIYKEKIYKENHSIRKKIYDSI